MKHLAFQAKGPRVELEADYVVVGSGAGGASAAVVLARAGARVVVVEAGAWRDPEDYPFTTYGAMRDQIDDFGARVTTGPRAPFWPILQGRAVGGSTVINSAICVRTPEDIFAQWRDEHGLSDPELSRKLWEHQDRIEEELCVEEVPASSAGRSNQLASKADQALGYEGRVMRRYVKSCAGSAQCLQGCRAQRKQSTNVNYIPEVMQRGGVLLSCAPVKKVVFDSKKAIGVRGNFEHPRTRKRGVAFFVRAHRAVIVAASATHSAALLLRSGVRNRSLGAYFRAHPGTGVFGSYEERVDMERGATQGWATAKFREDPGIKLETLSLPLEVVASRLAGGGAQLTERAQEFPWLALWVLAVRAESVGRVVCSLSGGPSVRYVLNRKDMLRFREGLKLVAKMHFAAGAKAVIPGVYGLPYKITADQLAILDEAPLDPHAYIGVLSHLFGGCVMGNDPARSVCDPLGRVRGYEGLAVADASVIPTNLGVNPQHTIMALASYIAEGLLD